MEPSGESQPCPHCGARVPPRAAWCSLCLTPVISPQRAAPAARTTVDAMLVELTVTDRFGTRGGGLSGRVLQLGTASRFIVAFVLAAALALLSTGAVTLLGAVLD